MSDAVVTGPIARRRRMMAKGEITAGHAHAFDHVTLCQRGSMEVAWIEGGVRRAQVLSAAHLDPVILIPAGVEHMLTGLEDGTIYQCIYPHRDENGDVVSEYTGRDNAYA